MPSTLKFFGLLSLFAPFVLHSQESLESDDEWFVNLMEVKDFDFADDELFETESAIERETEELMAAIRSLTAWSSDLSVNAALGWKDNVLLAESDEISSVFGQAEIDYFAFKPGLGKRTELLAILYGEYKYYEDVPGLESESLVTFRGSASRRLFESWKTTFAVEGVRSEQAFDASTEEFETEATKVVFWEPQTGIEIENTQFQIGTISISSYFGRGTYDLSSENYDSFSSSLGISRSVSKRVRLKANWQRYVERYDERLSRLSDGILEDDTLLELRGNRFSSELIYSKNRGLLRRLKTRFQFEAEDDRVGDYYERDRWQFQQSLELGKGEWGFDASIAFGDLRYDSRMVSLITEDVRVDKTWRWNAELRRSFGEYKIAFLRAEGSDKDSNSSNLSYSGNSVLLGMRFTGIGQKMALEKGKDG